MRARPVRFSVSTGLRLCGMAEEPFWPGEKYSSASRTSERWRWRTSVASRSIRGGDHAERGEEHGVAVARDHLGGDRLGREAEFFSATYSSTRGSILAKVPTAPEMAQVAISATRGDEAGAAAVELGTKAWASFSPKVVRSAWMPWSGGGGGGEVSERCGVW